MDHHAVELLIVALLCGFFHPIFAQEQTPGARASIDQQKVVVSTSEVRLDAVVKDKKGHPVPNLAVTDFEVYEDGVRQEIQSFRQVGGTAIAVTKTNRGTPVLKEGSPSTLGADYIALVFDRLSPSARTLAHDAALTFVNGGLKSNDFVGVFGTATNLTIIQQYTNSTPLIKAGIDRVGLQTAGEFTPTREKVRSDRLELQATTDPIRKAELRFEIRTLDSFGDFEGDRQGFATTDGLLALIDSLQNVKGRKSVIFFSEGVMIPSAVQAHFQSVISSANRANVTIYAVDAAGLRAESSLAETRKEIESRSTARQAEMGTESEGTMGAMTKELERNEGILTLNSESALSRLADQTGGMFIRDSNDLKTRMIQISDDMSSYYVLTYIPQNGIFDGTFRKTEVKLKPKGVTIQSRKGYFAINASFASPVLEFEAPALAAVSNSIESHDIPVNTTALAFPESDRRGLVVVLAELPLSSIEFHSDQLKRLYSIEFVLITLIRDEAGQVVRKLSKQYTLSGPLDAMPSAKKGQVLFYRETDLELGKYKIETIAYDAYSKKTGLKKGQVNLIGSPDTEGTTEVSNDALRLSSVVIVSRAEPLGVGEQKASNPLRVGEMQVYPLMAEVHKSTTKQLPFYFSVYQEKPTEKTVPRITIELLQGGKVLAQVPGEAPAADGTGRRQFVGALPLERLPPGTYELKITVTDGRSNLTASRIFALEM